MTADQSASRQPGERVNMSFISRVPDVCFIPEQEMEAGALARIDTSTGASHDGKLRGYGCLGSTAGA